MPSSSKEGKIEIVEWCRQLESVERILDIGVGKGTYWNVFCKKNNMFLNAEWIGVEAWQPYIEHFTLEKKYSKIINEDIRKVNVFDLGKLDVVFMGDVLEHITKEEAVELVHNLSSVTRYGIISIPIVHYPQGEEHGNPFEAHVKDDWSHDEVLATFPNITKTFKGNVIGCYLLDFT
jgi:cyclopropane fatty-acyl-phospholipid synthase-like methyltransferase